MRRRRSLYLRIYLLEVSSPSSDKCSSPWPSLNVEIISGACANSLCNVGETLAQWNWLIGILQASASSSVDSFVAIYRRVGLLLCMCEFQLCGALTETGSLLKPVEEILNVWFICPVKNMFASSFIHNEK